MAPQALATAALVAALAAPWSAPVLADPGLSAEFPNGATLRVEAEPATAHGTWVAKEGALEFRGDGFTVRYDLVALDPSAGTAEVALEALLAARLGEAEAHRPDVGALPGFAARVGAEALWLAQTTGGREVGRPPALALAADLPGQRLAIVQATFPWRESWQANADFVELLRRLRLFGGAPLAPATSPRTPGAAGAPASPAGEGEPAGAEAGGWFEPFAGEAPPLAEGARDIRVALPGGGALVFRAVPGRGWRALPGGIAHVEGPHRAEIRVVDAGSAPAPEVAARALLRAGGRSVTTRRLSAAPEGAEGPAWIAETTSGPYRAVVAFVAGGRAIALEIGPVAEARWRRWREEARAALRGLAVEVP